jgi:thiosulfate/3-mercaptopyruvate sulfurtransferase
MFKVKANTASNLHATREYDYTTIGLKSTIGLIALSLSLGLLIPGVYAGCACSAVGNWNPSGFLNSDVPGVQSATESAGTSATSSTGSQNAPQTAPRSALFPDGQILKPLQSVSSSDLVLDVSNDNSYSQSHIKGALHVSSKSFLNDDGRLKPVSELAKILGDSGVSRKDPVVIYSDNLADSTFIFWTLRHLGHDDVKVLDGSLEDWKAAKLPFEASQNTRPEANYTPSVRQELLADYKNVTSGSALIVDARPFMEFSKARIPTSISMDFTKVLENGKIKNRDALTNVFSGLAKNKPVIVYSSDYNRASLLWYALQLMGYNAKIYTWQDWAVHQPASEKSKTALAGKNNTANTGRYKNLGTT